MELIDFGFAILTLVLIKQLIFNFHYKRASKYVYSQSNWEELSDKWFINISYFKLVFHPFKWTYKQYYKGLENND